MQLATFGSSRGGHDVHLNSGLNRRGGQRRIDWHWLSRNLIFHPRRPADFVRVGGGRQLCVSFECLLPLPVRTECGAGAELGFQPTHSTAVWTCGNSQGDAFCGFDVFGQRRFSLTEVQILRTADAFGYSLAFGRIFGHPVEGAGHFGGGSSRLVRLGLLPVEFGDPGVEFGATTASAAAELVALVFGDCRGGGRRLGGLDGGAPLGLKLSLIHI